MPAIQLPEDLTVQGKTFDDLDNGWFCIPDYKSENYYALSATAAHNLPRIENGNVFYDAELDAPKTFAQSVNHGAYMRANVSEHGLVLVSTFKAMHPEADADAATGGRKAHDH